MKIGIILDMDGVIVDSEPIHLEATNRVLKSYGVRLTYEENVPLQGMAEIPYWKFLMKKFNFSEDIEKLISLKEKHMFDILSKSNLKPSPCLREFLEALKKREISVGLASSSQLSQIRFTLEKLELVDYFDVVTSGEEVEKGKPEPDIFLETAKRMQVIPKNCVVIEDSRNGLLGAIKAGMKVIAFRNSYNLPVDMKIDSFCELLDLGFLEELGLLNTS